MAFKFLKDINKDTAKRFAGDGALNLIASLIYTAMMQLVIMPYLASNMTEASYGEVLLLIGLATVAWLTFGNSLNNIRQIYAISYQKKGFIGDFNILFAWGCVGAVALTAIPTRIFVPSATIALTTQVCIIALLGTAGQYFSAFYYISLNLKKLIVQNVWFCVGTIAGLALVHWLSAPWTVIYICGQSSSVAYAVHTSGFMREPFKRTSEFRITRREYGILMTTSIISSSMVYLDRFFLYPVLGAADVAIYSTAAFFGKSMSLLVEPLNAVLLGYITKKNTLKVSSFIKQTFFAIAICVLFYYISICGIGKWITGLLYPTLTEQAIPYLSIANLATLIGVAVAIISPSILVFCNRRWLIVLQLLRITLYILLGLWATFNWGLWGFCIAVLALNAGMFLINFLLGAVSLSERK